METAIITGASQGIGNALAVLMLRRGYKVLGISRTVAKNCIDHDHFYPCRVDLSDFPAATERLKQFFFHDHGLTRVARLFLNAGVFGQRIAPMAAVPYDDFDYVMRLNVWANKLLLDLLFAGGVSIETCVVSSSIAGVRARAGFSSYAISKAAVNMMMKLYAQENPSTFFAVLGLCFVDTRLSRHILTAPLEGDFPEIVALRGRAETEGYLVSPEQRALDIESILSGRPRQHLTSGEFIDLRAFQRMMVESASKAV
jgi:NAD(P)-dependent dehydrogenase (short-subunit alcohol dehydrogenase family)